MSRSPRRIPLRQCSHLPLSYELVLSLVLCLLLPWGAQAETAGDAQTYLLSARRLYEGLDYEGALRQIQLARQLPRSRDQELTLLLYEGILLAELNQWEESSASFRTVFALKPEAQLPVQVSPKVQARFEALRDQARQELATQSVPAAERDAPLAKPEPPGEPVPLSPQAPPAVTAESPPPLPAEEGSQARVLIPAIAGGSLVVAGGISWALSRGELNRLRTGASSLQNEKDVQRSVSRGHMWQTLGLSLVGAGAAGLLTAAGFYVWGGPAEPMTLGAGTDGSAAFIYGRWP